MIESAREWTRPDLGLGEAVIKGFTQRMVLASIRDAALRSEDSPLRRFILDVTSDEELVDVS